MMEENNVIPIRKTDRFTLCTGKLHKDGSIEEFHKIGNAYLKPGAKTFRLKFWMYPRESYFLSRDHESDLIYTILSVEVQATESNGSIITDLKVSWTSVYNHTKKDQFNT